MNTTKVKIQPFFIKIKITFSTAFYDVLSVSCTVKYILCGISEHGSARAYSDDVMRTVYAAGHIIFAIVRKSLVNDLLYCRVV